MFNPEETVHIAVHVQKAFYDPPSPTFSEEQRQPYADQRAQRLADTAKSFSEAGVPTFWACMSASREISKKSAQFHIADPSEGDIVLEGGYQRSAIKTANMLELLRERGAKTLLISGGYASMCVTETVKDALAEGFQVYVMKDCLHDRVYGNEVELREMFSAATEKNKAVFIESADALRHLGIEPVARPVDPALKPTKFLV